MSEWMVNVRGREPGERPTDLCYERERFSEVTEAKAASVRMRNDSETPPGRTHCQVTCHISLSCPQY